MSVGYAVVSRYENEKRACIRTRFANLLAMGASILTTTPHVEGTVYLPNPRINMPGLYGSSQASKDSKKRFLLWANRTHFDYVWHIEDDTRIAPNSLERYSDETHDVIASHFRHNTFYMRYCDYCKKHRHPHSFAWPAIRLSRRMIQALTRVAMSSFGHHEPLVAAVCRAHHYRSLQLKNSHIVLPSNNDEHQNMRVNLSTFEIVHPAKCLGKRFHSSTNPNRKH